MTSRQKHWYIDREDYSFRGKYKRADGNWRYTFYLEEGDYIITKDVTTNSGTLITEFRDEDQNFILSSDEKNKEFSVSNTNLK